MSDIIKQDASATPPPAYSVPPAGQAPTADPSSGRLTIYSNVAGGMMVGTALGGVPGFIVGGIAGLATGVFLQRKDKI
jgi:predicted lipid-binding transport protein (Tim44 family)